MCHCCSTVPWAGVTAFAAVEGINARGNAPSVAERFAFQTSASAVKAGEALWTDVSTRTAVLFIGH